jgi:plasmid segregation protein ParM
MGEATIDLLVVGLPMNGMANAGKLKELVVGEHVVADGKRVKVKDALVVPQPVGGLYYCLSLGDFDENLADMADETNLIVDPGYLTFDFLVSHGKKVIENRSNAHPGGVSKVLRLIAESVSTKFNINYDNLGAIESGLVKRKIKINGKVEDLLEHIRSTKPVLDGSVNYMKNIVGDGSDIDNILLIGGGAGIYRKTIEEYYPNHTVTVVDNSPLANVIGFQRIGDSYINSGS